MPAKTLVNVVCAARPASTPTIPADASNDAPNVRSCVNVMNIDAIAMTQTAAAVSLRTIATCVRSRRTRRLSGTSIRRRCMTASSMTNRILITSHAAVAIKASRSACRNPSTTRFSNWNNTM
jgi:hypothetical protein